MLRRDEGFYIPLLPASSQTSYPSLRRKRQSSLISLLLLSPQNLWFCGEPHQTGGFCFSKILHLCRNLRHKTQLSYCRRKAFAASAGSKGITLDFPTENRVPTGMLAPLLETQRQRDAPFAIPHFPRRCIYNLKNLFICTA